MTPQLLIKIPKGSKWLWWPWGSVRHKSADTRSKLQQAKLQRRQYKMLGRAAILAGVTLSGCLVYQEIRSFQQRFQTISNIFHTRKGHDTYIYVFSNEYPDDDEEDTKKPAKRKLKKLKKALSPWIAWLQVQTRSHDPKTLLTLAQSHDHNIRLMGVKALAANHGWHDSDYRRIAQCLDQRTLIGLARTPGVDRRFFLPAPKLSPSKEPVEDEFRRLLAELPVDGVDRCTQFFTASALKGGKGIAPEERGGMWCFGGNGLALAQELSPVPPERVELFCLQALAKHALVPTHCVKIVELGGLQLLQRIYESRRTSLKIQRNIARVISNLSIHEGLHDEIVRAGWVGVLTQWLRCPDLAISMHAAKTLANLDMDFGIRPYLDGVYLYYPQHRYSEPVYADVVFIHGLLGGPFRTWRQQDQARTGPQVASKADQQSKTAIRQQDQARTGLQVADKAGQQSKTAINHQSTPPSDSSQSTASKASAQSIQPLAHSAQAVGQPVNTKQPTAASDQSATQTENTTPVTKLKSTDEEYTFCWPKDWLAKDVPNIRILTVEYETHLSEWSPRCPYESEKRSIAVRSADIMTKLRKAGIGDRPIIWVGHSMGGLIIKQMLLTSSRDARLRSFLDQTKGILFYGVPHRGSSLAAASNQARYLLCPSVEVQELRQGSTMLTHLHENFTRLVQETEIPVLSFGEGQKTDTQLNMKLMIVPPESSDPGFGEYHEMSELNHLNICKPLHRDASLYQLTLSFIRDRVPVNLVRHILRASLPSDSMVPENKPAS